MPRKKKIIQPVKHYVMFGFNKDDIDVVGYWKAPNLIVTDRKDATVFSSQNVNNLTGFGTPQQWLKLVNEDEDMNQNYQFHLISVIASKKS